MTFSIVAWDEITGMTGVAVLTKFFAVGSSDRLPRQALALLEPGGDVEDAVNILLKSDEGREHR